jgi:2-(1,2-epoxy-1,2-dihydrophenyl)acetyl-CoA isomerase
MGFETGCPNLRVAFADGVASLILDRPDAGNALTPEMVEALIRATTALERDSDVRCVVLRATGDNFAAGGDVKGFHKSLTQDRDAHLAGMERRVANGNAAVHRLRRMTKPVLASVQGAVAGYGLSMFLSADLTIAADNAFFLMAYRHIGLTPDGGSSHLLPRLIGERRAMELTLMGNRIDAAKALAWGLVNWTVPADELVAQTDKIARGLARGPTYALGHAKRLIRAAFNSSWDDQVARENEQIAHSVASADHLEGVQAFVEKRSAVFVGK